MIQFLRLKKIIKIFGIATFRISEIAIFKILFLLHLLSLIIFS